MSTSNPTDPRRPRALHISRSFTRLESPNQSPASPSRMRASTIQTPTIPRVPEARDISSSLNSDHAKKGDIFESVDEQEEHGGSQPPLVKEAETESPATFDQLPIEIRSLTERFLKSLSVKAHAAPLNIDSIADLFQDFYIQAESHISTHIATLSTRIGRENSPAPSTSTAKNSIMGRKRAGSSAAQTTSPDVTGEQQMLTPTEISDRRKARRMLEHKRVALEEAVERGLCEKVYDKIYRHRSADDEERDAKLRSRTAALALVGIGLKELHVNIDSENDSPEEALKQEEKIKTLLIPAMESLRQMDNEHYPLGKLHKLTEAHKNIVETLSHLFPSSSSADEVLPTLIYTLITSNPDTLNVISNLHFIQLFRSRNKVDGEAAYCLVNLEAAISFLETVDLSSLRADEAPEGPHKTASRPQTPNKDGLAAPVQAASPKSITPSLTPVSATASNLSPGETVKPLPSPSSLATRPNFPHRRLSSLIQAQAERIEEGRVELLNSADQAFDAINSTLENSFKFLFGRMKEQQVQGLDSPVVLPKTLEEARQLISSPDFSLPEEELISGRSSIHESPISETPDDPLSVKPKEKPERDMLSIVGGRLRERERSVDSTKSIGSGKRVAFDKSPLEKMSPSPAGSTASAADQVGNLMNSINPLKGFSVPSFGGFRRSVSAASTPAPFPPATEKTKQMGHIPETAAAAQEKERTGNAEVKEEEDLSAMEALAQLKKTKPPMRRFMEVQDATELRIGEVEELLKDYRRLAAAVRDAINS